MASFNALHGKASITTREPAPLPPRPSATTNAIAGIDPDLARKVAEAKKQVAATLATKAVRDNPYMSAPTAPGKKKAPQPEAAPQGAGLKMAAHPLLLDTAPTAVPSKKDRYKPMQPKFASIKANARTISTPTPPPPPVVTEQKANPYASGEVDDAGFDAAPKERGSRSFRFNQKGKYIQQGNQMRQEAQLEALKQRIAESARKAGLNSEFETLEKNIRREPPPVAEWWDVSLLPNKTYDDLAQGLDSLHIRTENSPITLYVQHPIPIPAPWDKYAVEAKALKLTKKEQKKMRKQRRQAEQQDKQDRIRMGLAPPDPPKVRLANLMKVLTSEAVQDPTKVEARVQREVAQRRKNHEKMNQERKLTDEQRREKLENKKTDEERKGIYGAAFKINTLTDPSHRFKVRKNAEQMGLVGLCVFNPSFNLVVVEGSSKAIRQYTRLMTVRIAWTEASRPRHGGGDYEEADGGDEDTAPTKRESTVVDEVSLENNKCEKIWEGPLRDHTFTTFKARSCPTDTSAKDALGSKWATFWDAAKMFVAEDEL